MASTVAVVGGGYGGISVAKSLDDTADVVLIERRDTFVHNVAALRSLVDPAWADRLFFGYDRLLRRGRVLHQRVTRVDPAGVTLGSGEHLAADYVVLATGSTYPFPAKVDVDDSVGAKAKLRATHHALAAADSVLLLGAGPVGLELAGEIKAAWADKTVTIVDPAEDILSGGFSAGFPYEYRAELRRQLDALGVQLLLGTSLREPPPGPPGEARRFTTTTHSGRQLTADVWFRCFGVVPVTDYLAGELATARQANGYLEVTGELRLPGQERVFAIGDITAIPEAKQAGAATAHAGVVAANIRTLLRGGSQLTVYQPGPPGIVLPLGPKGGASYVPGWESHVDAETASEIRARGDRLVNLDILGAEMTSQFKGADLMVAENADFFELER